MDENGFSVFILCMLFFGVEVLFYISMLPTAFSLSCLCSSIYVDRPKLYFVLCKKRVVVVVIV